MEQRLTEEKVFKDPVHNYIHARSGYMAVN